MAEAIPALTIWQPWATLIAEGVKPHEFRRWAAPRRLVGKRLAIHAGARPIRRDEVQDLLLRLRQQDEAWSTGLATGAAPILERMLQSPGLVPLSAVVCLATLGAPVLAHTLIDPGIGDSDRVDHQMWAWPLTDIERLDPAIPARGAQGFWTWRQEVSG